MNVHLLETIRTISNKNLYLPNSVFVNANKVVITDGGNNRICVIDGRQEYNFGTFGIGKYKFKEPVYSMIFEDKLFVCDWHNHRIVQYEDKKFKNQIGIFGNKDENTFRVLLKLIKSFASNGSFIEKHFNTSEIEKSKKPSIQRLLNILKGQLFYGVNINLFIKNLINKTFINKPNGCIILDDKLIFTQKNNRCISVYDFKKKEIVQEIDSTTQDIAFGRLGQISYFDEKIYVCDETNNLIWIFSKDFCFINKKTITNYNVFSISLNDYYIATCGENGFSIFNQDFKLLFEKMDDGEYHGIALDGDILFVCNRLKNRIEKYKIQKDKK
jgi:hypothetical protein